LQFIRNLLTRDYVYFSQGSENIGVPKQFKAEAKHAFEFLKTILPPSAEKTVRAAKPLSPEPHPTIPQDISHPPTAPVTAPKPKKSTEQTAELFKQAAKQPPPKEDLGPGLYYYVHGKFDPVALAAAINRYEKAAAQTDGHYACSELGDYYELYATPPDLQKAEQFYKRGLLLVNDINWKGLFCSRLADNLDKQCRYADAFYYYRKSAELYVNGDCYNIARYMLEEKGGAKRDIEEIKKQLRACCFQSAPAWVQKEARDVLISLIAKSYIDHWSEEKKVIQQSYLTQKDNEFIEKMDLFVKDLKATNASAPFMVPGWLNSKLFDLEHEQFQKETRH
jgi:tetratricopeptide (TPR) repeat protein